MHFKTTGEQKEWGVKKWVTVADTPLYTPKRPRRQDFSETSPDQLFLYLSENKGPTMSILDIVGPYKPIVGTGWTKEYLASLPVVFVNSEAKTVNLRLSDKKKIFADLGISPKTTIETDNGNSAFLISEKMECIAINSCQCRRRPDREYYSINDVIPPRKLGLVVIKDAWQPDSCRLFMEICQEVLPEEIRSNYSKLEPWQSL